MTKIKTKKFSSVIWTLAALLMCANIANAGFTKAKHHMEIIPFKFSVNAGAYRSRLPNSTPAEKAYQHPSFFIQVYFPFKRSVDTPENFENGDSDPKYYDRLFSAVPFAAFHLTDKLGNASALGQELRIRIYRRLFANIQLGVAWVESMASTNDGLKTGWNFHNYWYLSCFVNKRLSLNAGYVHISNGRVWNPPESSIYDQLTFGASYSLKRKN